MTLVKHSVYIEAAVPTVFEYASNWHKWEEWFQGVSQFKAVNGEEMENGTRFSYFAKMAGVKSRIETEITQYEKDRGWIGITYGAVPGKTYWNFQEDGKGTLFTFGVEYTLQVPLVGKLLDRILVKPQWEKLIKASLANLKERF